MIQQNIYYDLDTLLDTRVGLVVTHFPDRMTDSNLERYHTRLSMEVWKCFDIDEESWKEVWNKRDVQVLSNSAHTLMFALLPQLLISCSIRSKVSNIYEKATITVNTFPYELSAAEIDAMKDVFIYQHLPPNIEVEFIFLEYPTPEIIYNRWGIVHIYDINEWGEKVGYLLKDSPIPKIMFHIPNLAIKSTEDIDKFAEEAGSNFMQQIQLYLSTALHLEPLDHQLFDISNVNKDEGA